MFETTIFVLSFYLAPLLADRLRKMQAKTSTVFIVFFILAEGGFLVSAIVVYHTISVHNTVYAPLLSAGLASFCSVVLYLDARHQLWKKHGTAQKN